MDGYIILLHLMMISVNMKQSTFAKLKATAQLMCGAPIVLGGLSIMGMGLVSASSGIGFLIFCGGIVVVSVGSTIFGSGLESFDEARELQKIEEKNKEPLNKQSTAQENTSARRTEPLKTIKLNSTPVVKKTSTAFVSNNNFIYRLFQKIHSTEQATPVLNLNNYEIEFQYKTPQKK